MANENKKQVEQITNMEVDFAQWYTDVCTKAELIDYSSIKGMFIYRPYGYAIWENIQAELDRELLDIGFGVRDFNIIGISYPPEVQRMAERVAAQAFVGDVGRYAAINLADNLGQNGGGAAGLAAQFAMGNQMAQQMNQAFANNNQNNQNNPQPQGDRFCPQCRTMVSSKFCPDCGTQTV